MSWQDFLVHTVARGLPLIPSLSPLKQRTDIGPMLVLEIYQSTWLSLEPRLAGGGYAAWKGIHKTKTAKDMVRIISSSIAKPNNSIWVAMKTLRRRTNNPLMGFRKQTTTNFPWFIMTDSSTSSISLPRFKCGGVCYTTTSARSMSSCWNATLEMVSLFYSNGNVLDFVKTKQTANALEMEHGQQYYILANVCLSSIVELLMGWHIFTRKALFTAKYQCLSLHLVSRRISCFASRTPG